MPTKRFKGKTCAYCGGIGTAQTGDHVIARGFFLLERRDNLPQVPACGVCNGNKSILEHYITSTLPFGGCHPDSGANLADQVPPRLAKNLPLSSELQRGTKYIWRSFNESPWKLEVTLPFKGQKAIELYVLILKGLANFHWDILLPDEECTVGAAFIRAEHAHMFERLLGLHAHRRVTCDLGNGTFIYEGAQSADHSQLTVWRMSLYGAVIGNGMQQRDRASVVYGFSAPKHIQAGRELAALLMN